MALRSSAPTAWNPTTWSTNSEISASKRLPVQLHTHYDAIEGFGNRLACNPIRVLGVLGQVLPGQTFSR